MKIRRKIKFWWQHLTRGWDDSDTWALDYTIAKFVLPRLKRFRELNIGHPGNLTMEKWNSMLDDMIFSFEFTVNEETYRSTNDDDWERYYRGLKYFGKYFGHLWW